MLPGLRGLPASEYDGGARMFGLDGPYHAVVAVLGKGFLASEPGYPDDNYKTDVCWYVEDIKTGARLTVWNYKNGPNYSGRPLQLVDHFSVYYQDGREVPGSGVMLWERVQRAVERED
jgi:hypothetical protein